LKFPKRRAPLKTRKAVLRAPANEHRKKIVRSLHGKKKRPIPEFKNEDEEQKLWAAADSTHSDRR
jgi:hypothetical protein